jgi:hypothetical protein
MSKDNVYNDYDGFPKAVQMSKFAVSFAYSSRFLQAVVVWFVVFYFASLSPSSFISGLSLG